MSAVAGADQNMDAGTPFLEVNDLRMYFPVTEGIIIQRKVAEVKAVDGISFAMKKGETLGLVGESGCGKTTTGRCILQLEKITSGQIVFDGVDISTYDKAELSQYRQRMQVIFQDPFSSLNPRMKIREILAEPMKVHRIVPNARKRDERVRELLNICGLSTRFADSYPHEMSGGQRQRVGIARALSVNPQFIVCDEAVSALDVLPFHLARFERRSPYLPPGCSDVSGQDGRIGRLRRAVRQSDSPLHQGASRCRADPRSDGRSGARTQGRARRNTQPHESAERLRIPPEMRIHGRWMQSGGPGVSRSKTGALGCLH